MTLIGLGIGVVGSAAVCAENPDSMQARIRVAAITYDDGFGSPLKNPGGIWCDQGAGELFVADAGNGRVLIYDSLLNGKFSFQHYVLDPQSRRQIVGEPKGIAVNQQGEMLLIDGLTDVLDLVDFRGRLLGQVRPNQLVGDTTLKIRATFVTVDEHNQFYLLIAGDITKILVVDENLKLVRQLGEKGDNPGQFDSPIAIAVHRGRIYVGDMRGRPAVKIFDTTGQFLTGFGAHDVDRKDLSFPVGIGFLDNGEGGEYIVVADALRQVVKLYTPDFEFFTAIGGLGVEPGLLQYPSGFATDGPTSFYVAERVGGRVQRYETK